jgi:hypothetical protein
VFLLPKNFIIFLRRHEVPPPPPSTLLSCLKCFERYQPTNKYWT